VRLVAVESFNHVIAVAPCCGSHLIGLEAIALGITDEVEPIQGPSFSITRRGEQPIDEFLIRIRRAVVYESLYLFRSRRKADHVKVKTANEREMIGLRRWC